MGDMDEIRAGFGAPTSFQQQVVVNVLLASK
jgi:hypothetical protein